MKKICFLLLTVTMMFAGTALAQTSITAGDMVISSKLMTFFKNVYVARGGLKAEQKDSTLTADRGIYDRDLEIVKAIDNVTVIQPGSVMTSDYLEAYVKEDRIVGRGNPKLVRIVERAAPPAAGEEGPGKVRKTRVILTCNEIEGFNKENRYLAKGNVRVIETAYREGETEEEAAENEKAPVSDLKCEILEIFSNEDKAIARNSVEIVTETLRATGDKAIYLNSESRMVIVGHAHAFQTTKETGSNAEQVSELYANKIIYYPNEDRTIAVGNVQATVYPGSGGGAGKKDKDKDKDKKKKKKKTEGEETPEGGVPVGTVAIKTPESSIVDLPEGIPTGEYTKVSEEEYIEATEDE